LQNKYQSFSPILFSDLPSPLGVCHCLHWDLKLGFKLDVVFCSHLKFADELKVPFLETSVKTDTNVEQVIKMIAEEIKKKL